MLKFKFEVLDLKCSPPSFFQKPVSLDITCHLACGRASSRNLSQTERHPSLPYFALPNLLKHTISHSLLLQTPLFPRHYHPEAHQGSSIRLTCERRRAILCCKDRWDEATSSSHPLKHFSVGNIFTSLSELYA